MLNPKGRVIGGGGRMKPLALLCIVMLPNSAYFRQDCATMGVSIIHKDLLRGRVVRLHADGRGCSSDAPTSPPPANLHSCTSQWVAPEHKEQMFIACCLSDSTLFWPNLDQAWHTSMPSAICTPPRSNGALTKIFAHHIVDHNPEGT